MYNHTIGIWTHLVHTVFLTHTHDTDKVLLLINFYSIDSYIIHMYMIQRFSIDSYFLSSTFMIIGQKSIGKTGRAVKNSQ